MSQPPYFPPNVPDFYGPCVIVDRAYVRLDDEFHSQPTPIPPALNVYTAEDGVIPYVNESGSEFYFVES